MNFYVLHSSLTSHSPTISQEFIRWLDYYHGYTKHPGMEPVGMILLNIFKPCMYIFYF